MLLKVQKSTHWYEKVPVDWQLLKLNLDWKLRRIQIQNIVNFLDITFDLGNGRCKPYRKPHDDPLYINKNSNHPPSIMRQLPTASNRRISLLSSDKQTFDECVKTYQDALDHSKLQTTIRTTKWTKSYGKPKTQHNIWSDAIPRRSRRCNLRLREKFWTLKADKQNLLNKGSELVSACRHKSLFNFGQTKGAAASIV